MAKKEIDTMTETIRRRLEEATKLHNETGKEIEVLSKLLSGSRSQAQHNPNGDSLTNVIMDVMRNAPEGKMSRTDIIQKVKERGYKKHPIGIVSALHNRKLFRQFGKETFSPRERETVHDSGVPEASVRF